MIFRSAVSVRARLIIAALAVCSVALAGCQGGDATGSPENTTTTTTSTSSATPTPTPTPSGVYKPADASGKAQNVPLPVKPPLADQNSKEGLEAFTKYWYQTLSYAYETGDQMLVKTITGPACAHCDATFLGLTQSWTDGKWIVGGIMQTPSVTATLKADSTPQALVQVLQSEIEIRKPDGSLYQPATIASNYASGVKAEHKDGIWIVNDRGLIVG